MTDPIEAMARAIHDAADNPLAVYETMREMRRAQATAARDAHLAALSETHLIVPLEGLEPEMTVTKTHEDGTVTVTPLYTLEGIKP